MTQEEFSKKFKELFTGMIQAAYDYVEHDEEVEEIYVYADMEGMFYYKAFYRIKGQFVKMHEVNNVLSKQVDTGFKRTSDILDLGIDDAENIHNLFKEYQGKAPTNMKFIFTVETNHFDSEINYDKHHTNTKDLLPSHIFEQWFEEVAGSE